MKTLKAHWIEKQFPCEAHVGDAKLGCVSWTWLRDFYCPKFKNLLKRHGLTYKSELTDCDDYAQWFSALFKVYFRERFSMVKVGAAIGEIWYVSAELGPHAINVGYFGPKGTQAFIEPQTQEEIELTRKEQRSIYYVRF
jgi:hypothetical protein